VQKNRYSALPNVGVIAVFLQFELFSGHNSDTLYEISTLNLAGRYIQFSRSADQRKHYSALPHLLPFVYFTL